MDRLNPITDAPEHAGPRRSEDNAASQVLTVPIGAGIETPRGSPTGEAGAPNLSTPGAVAGAAQSVGSAGYAYELEVTTPLARILSHKTAPTAAKPWGTQPVCPKCNRGKLSSCICNVPEPEPEYFKPAVRYDPDGWHRVEF